MRRVNAPRLDMSTALAIQTLRAKCAALASCESSWSAAFRSARVADLLELLYLHLENLNGLAQLPYVLVFLAAGLGSG